MKLRRRILTVQKRNHISKEKQLAEQVDDKQRELEEKEANKIRKKLKKKGIFFAHNTGLKKLKEKLEAAQ